jgi:hypothetical protein
LRGPSAGTTNVIAAYVGFLAAGRELAIEYVLGLLEEADVVVLCERAHSETTRCDFILSLLSDRRVREGVGHLFTEIGSSSLDSAAAEFMNAEGLSAAEVNARRRYMHQNLIHEPIWEKANY